MDKNLKSTLLAITYGIILFTALIHLDVVLAFVGHVGHILLPVLVGLLLAFVLNVPVTGVEHLICKLFRGKKRNPKGKLLRLCSLLLTLICVALVLTLLITAVIPEVIRTVKSIIALVEEHWPEWLAALNEMNVDTSVVSKWLGDFDLQQMTDQIAGHVGALVGSVASAATSTVSTVVQVLIGFVMALYILMDRENLARQSKKLLYANIKTSAADKICEICSLIKDSYTKYLSGQCIEAIILGTLILTTFLIFHIPYATLMAMVTSVCALVPYIGATVSCIIAVLLTLLAEPQKALLCLIVYLVVQFVETQFIYPHVVGSSVGLSPLWTLLAVMVGGKLCGFVGVIFFIPLTAALYTLLKKDTEKKLDHKKIQI